jgi:serine O-acetyltransferase
MSAQPSLRQLLAADVGARDARALSLLPRLGTVRGMSSLLFRLAQRVGPRNAALGHLLKTLLHVLTGADIAWQATVGPGLALMHPTGVVIGPDVVIGADCKIQQGVTLGAGTARGLVRDGRVDSPVIGDGVSIGSGAKVIGPVDIGDHARIGANAVVVKDVPAGSVAVGVPAVVRAPRGSST